MSLPLAPNSLIRGPNRIKSGVDFKMALYFTVTCKDIKNRLYPKTVENAYINLKVSLIILDNCSCRYVPTAYGGINNHHSLSDIAIVEVY